MVKVILEREDVTPDTADKDGRTPLLWAARNGHWDIVVALLGRKDVAPDAKNKSGRTPLSWAAIRWHEGLVGMLLERGVSLLTLWIKAVEHLSRGLGYVDTWE